MNDNNNKDQEFLYSAVSTLHNLFNGECLKIIDDDNARNDYGSIEIGCFVAKCAGIVSTQCIQDITFSRNNMAYLYIYMKQRSNFKDVTISNAFGSTIRIKTEFGTCFLSRGQNNGKSASFRTMGCKTEEAARIMIDMFLEEIREILVGGDSMCTVGDNNNKRRKITSEVLYFMQHKLYEGDVQPDPVNEHLHCTPAGGRLNCITASGQIDPAVRYRLQDGPGLGELKVQTNTFILNTNLKLFTHFQCQIPGWVQEATSLEGGHGKYSDIQIHQTTARGGKPKKMRIFSSGSMLLFGNNSASEVKKLYSDVIRSLLVSHAFCRELGSEIVNTFFV